MGLSGLSGLSAFYGASYSSKVLSIQRANVLSYLKLAESSGSTAADASGNGRTAAMTSADVGQPGIGDGGTSYSFNGTSAFLNWYSTSLRDAFNGPAGTLAFWLKVAAAGTYADGVFRRALMLRADDNNRTYIFKLATGFRLNYTAGGTSKQVDYTTATTGWLHLALTWDKAADQMKAYANGAQTGATQTGLGTWAGTLNASTTTIGSEGGATNPWSGSLAHVALWSVALSAADVARLAVV